MPYVNTYMIAVMLSIIVGLLTLLCNLNVANSLGMIFTFCGQKSLHHLINGCFCFVYCDWSRPSSSCYFKVDGFSRMPVVYSKKKGLYRVESCTLILYAYKPTSMHSSHSFSSLASFFSVLTKVWFIRSSSPFVWGWYGLYDVPHQ